MNLSQAQRSNKWYMKQIEKTLQYLIAWHGSSNGEQPISFGFIYTSFQERATFISHGNTARLAKEHEVFKLAQVRGIRAATKSIMKLHTPKSTTLIDKYLFLLEAA